MKNRKNEQREKTRQNGSLCRSEGHPRRGEVLCRSEGYLATMRSRAKKATPWVRCSIALLHRSEVVRRSVAVVRRSIVVVRRSVAVVRRSVAVLRLGVDTVHR